MQAGIDATGEATRGGLLREAQALVTGLGSSAAVGLAVAAREGPASMAEHALGSAGVVAGTVVLGVAPLWVFALHLGLELGMEAVVGAVARAVRVTGVVLLGLSPTVALVSVSAESSLSAVVVGALALAVGGGLGLRALSGELRRAIGGAPFAKTRSLEVVVCGFALLAAVRLAWALLPLFRQGLGAES